MIVNADDFGLSSDVNRAIVEAFERGLVSSTTLMANAPAFEEACELAHERRLLQHVGTHLVLSHGAPLTEAIGGCRRFCDAEGCFFGWVGKKRVWRLDGGERDAVACELRAQIERCRERGLPVTHLDSHHNAHFEFGIAGVVNELARELGVGAVRLVKNSGPMSRRRRVYTAYVNARLRRSGLAATRYSGGVDDYLEVRVADFELVVHPVFDGNGQLMDASAPGVPLEGVDGLADAVSFSGARYR